MEKKLLDLKQKTAKTPQNEDPEVDKEVRLKDLKNHYRELIARQNKVVPYPNFTEAGD